MQQPLRLGRRGNQVLDAAVAGFLVVASLAPLVAGAVSAVEALLCLLQSAPLFWRRSRPVLAGTAVVLATAAQPLINDGPLVGQLAFPIAVMVRK